MARATSVKKFNEFRQSCSFIRRIKRVEKIYGFFGCVLREWARLFREFVQFRKVYECFEFLKNN